MISKHQSIVAGCIGASMGLLIAASFQFTEPDCAPRAETHEAPADVHVSRHYEGVFTWQQPEIDGRVVPVEQLTNRVQRVALDVRHRRTEQVDSGFRHQLLGRGTYTTARTADFDFDIQIAPDGRVSMRESNPSTNDFVTDGVHLGSIDSSGVIRANWVGEGGTGDLVLYPRETSQRR